MSFLSRLGTLADVQRTRRAQPKSAEPSRLEQKAAKDKADAKALAVWRAKIADRDEHTCRCCGVKTIKTLSLHPRRGEAHHLAGRADTETRYDTRAGLHLCLTCHQKVTRHELTIIGTAWFRKLKWRSGQDSVVLENHHNCINADYPLQFRGEKS